MGFSLAAEMMVALLEGLRLTAYQDGRGIWTIGYGHTLGVDDTTTCTKAQAIEWLREELGVAAHAVFAHVKVQLSQRQFDALCSLVFNVGAHAFAGSKLLARLNENDEYAAEEMLDWCYVTQPDGTKRISEGLQRRRREEFRLFESDRFPVAAGLQAA